MIEIVPATRTHVETLYKEAPGLSLRAVAAVDGERVLGVGGTYLCGGERIAFAKLTDELRHEHRRALVKACRLMLQTYAGRVFAKCDPGIPGAAAFLKHWGFQCVREDLFVWKA